MEKHVPHYRLSRHDPVGRVAYIKLTWVNEHPVVQFKEL